MKHWNKENQGLFHKTIEKAIETARMSVDDTKENLPIFALSPANVFNDSCKLPEWVRWEYYYAGVSETDVEKVAYVRYEDADIPERWSEKRRYCSLSKLLKRWGLIPDDKYGNDLLSQIAENYKSLINSIDKPINEKLLTNYNDIVDAYSKCSFGNYGFCMKDNPNDCLRFYAVNAEAGNCMLYTRWLLGKIITKAWLWKLPDNTWYLDKVYNDPQVGLYIDNKLVVDDQVLEISKSYLKDKEIEIKALAKPYIPFLDSFGYAILDLPNIILTNNLDKYEGRLCVLTKSATATSINDTCCIKDGRAFEMVTLAYGDRVPIWDAVICDKCGLLFLRDDILATEDGYVFCEACIDKETIWCDNCSAHFYKKHKCLQEER